MRNLLWKVAQAFALVVLLVWAGAFSLYVFPGRTSENQEITPCQSAAYVSPCDRMREQAIGRMRDGIVRSMDSYNLEALGCAAYPPTD
jgi:hypothetical protein